MVARVAVLPMAKSVRTMLTFSCANDVRMACCAEAYGPASWYISGLVELVNPMCAATPAIFTRFCDHVAGNPPEDGAVGVTEFDAAEAGLVPIALVAVTLKVYGVPFTKPLTTTGDDEAVAVIPPGVEVPV